MLVKWAQERTQRKENMPCFRQNTWVITWIENNTHWHCYMLSLGQVFQYSHKAIIYSSMRIILRNAYVTFTDYFFCKQTAAVSPRPNLHHRMMSPQGVLERPPTSHRPDQKTAANCFTVYPKKYAHGFVVLCFVVVMQSFIMNSHEVFIHIHQGCFAGTGVIVRLPQCQWSKPDGYGKISQCIITTKHSKAQTVSIFLGIYCMVVSGLLFCCPMLQISYCTIVP